MNYNILDVSRASSSIINLQIDGNPLIDNVMMSIASLSSLSNEDIKKLCVSIFPEFSEASEKDIFQKVTEFFLSVSGQLTEYSAEIERRKAHAIKIGAYFDDTPEEIEAKSAKNKDLYLGNQYLAGLILLSKNGIDYKNLTISEALIVIEDLTCAEINNGSYQILGMIGSDEPSTESRFKEILRHANFVAFALDIYEELDKVWQRIRDKKDSK
jgi:hypothetical protein